MKRNKVAKLMAVVALVGAVGVGGSLAFLTAQSNQVTNTFAAGNGINAATDITLFESDQIKKDATTNAYSVTVENNKKWSTTFRDGVSVDNWKDKGTIAEIQTYGVGYSDLTPNMIVTKDPRVQISENTSDCYVFVKVTNGLKDINGVAVDGILKNNGTSTVNWKVLDGVENVWYYVNNEDSKKEGFNKGSVINTDGQMYVTETLFNKITLNDDADIYNTDGTSKLGNNNNIEVKAYVVQATANENWNDAVEKVKSFDWGEKENQ